MRTTMIAALLFLVSNIVAQEVGIKNLRGAKGNSESNTTAIDSERSEQEEETSRLPSPFRLPPEDDFSNQCGTAQGPCNNDKECQLKSGGHCRVCYIPSPIYNQGTCQHFRWAP